MGEATRDGAELHRELGAEMWCVTRKDLRYLRRDVARAIRDATIVPTEQDAFDAADRFGPSIYTVNEQYIKPVTAAAGNMSWALMRHPKGKKCDLFITHAWQEGIFEFIDKVLHTWPIASRHAWCCMLANPQNLDISDLIKDPSSSPFAVALRSATYMLVVPNHKGSIYDRLWCVYEAFLAYESGKVVLTASKPLCTGGNLKRAFVLVMLASIAGFLGAWLEPRVVFDRDRLSIASDVVYFLQWAFVLASGLSHSDWRCWWNCLGAAVTAHRIGAALRCYAMSARPGRRGQQRDIGDCLGCFECDFGDVWAYFVRRLCGKGIFLMFFFFAEMDRVRSANAELEAQELVAGFTGSVWNARCANPEDERRIRDEVLYRVGRVDEAIQVLIDAGMSTPSLRRAVDLGVDVTGAAHREYAFPSYFLATAVSSALAMTSGESLWYCGLGWSLLALAFTWSLVFLRLPLDCKAFALLVVERLCLVLDTPFFIFMHILTMTGTIEREPLHRFGVEQWSLSDLLTCAHQSVLWSIIIALSLLRVDGVASIPLFGRFLAQVLVARGWRHFFGSCFPQLKAKQGRRPRLKEMRSLEEGLPGPQPGGDDAAPARGAAAECREAEPTLPASASALSLEHMRSRVSCSPGAASRADTPGHTSSGDHHQLDAAAQNSSARAPTMVART